MKHRRTRTLDVGCDDGAVFWANPMPRTPQAEDRFWVLVRPTFLSVRNSCVFVLYDLLKID